MASRRIRIKGLAKIPQRRKATTVPEDSEHSELNESNTNLKDIPTATILDDLYEQKEEIQQNRVSSNANLSEITETVNEKSTEDVEKSIPKSIQIRRQFIKPVVKVKEKLEEKIVSPPAISLSRKPETIEEKPDQSEENLIPKQTLAIRRKFIKPAVTIGAINRKNKELTENTPKKSDKIIILDNTVIVNPQITESINPITELTINSLIGSDVEYPPPPLSPTKINRSRIKAIPRFGQRHASFSASESEDETKRIKRIRHDSVCSTTSAIVETLPESPQKKEALSQQQKLRKTDQARKLAEARRGFYQKFGNNKPDRKKLTMMDLIFYNPTTNLMSQDTKKKLEKIQVEEIVEEVEEKSDSEDETNGMPAPQVKIGPNGEIVIDEQSLVIESKSLKKNREQIEKSNLIDGNLDTAYGIYKKAKRSKDWTKNETIKFYKALNTIGTDFTLMCELFPKRSHRELKQKFKKEERLNKHLIDRAVMQPCNFDFNEFKRQVELEERELEKQKSLQDTKAKRKHVSFATKNKEETTKKRKSVREKRKKDCLNIMSLCDDSEEESNISDFAEDNDGDNEDENESENDVVFQGIQKPTRSGRVPKLLHRYNAENPTDNKPEPGSLKVVTSSGPDGEPVYKVFMVTSEEEKQRGFGKGIISSLLKGANNEKILTVSVTKSHINPEENTTISAGGEDNEMAYT